VGGKLKAMTHLGKKQPEKCPQWGKKKGVTKGVKEEGKESERKGS